MLKYYEILYFNDFMQQCLQLYGEQIIAHVNLNRDRYALVPWFPELAASWQWDIMGSYTDPD